MLRSLKWAVAALLALAPATTFGQSYQGSFTQAGAGAVNRTMLDKARERVTFQDFGAKCDGSTDDTTAVNAAITYAKNTDFALDGLHKTCAVSGDINLSGNIWIQNVGFKQLNETSTTRTLFYRDSGTPTLINVTCNANGSTTGYDIANGACIWIDDNNVGTVQSPYLENVEVTGNGAGIGIMLANAINGKIVNPYIHDIYYTATVDPCIEQIIGIDISGDTNSQVINPYIARLGGTIVAGAPSGTCNSDGSVSPANTLRYYQTDGIDIGTGSTGVTISGGAIDRVGEGIDTGGSVLERDIWTNDTVLSNIDSFGLKQGHMTEDSGSIGVRCIDCGYSGLVVYGGTSPDTQGAENITHIAFTALDTGSNGYWSASNVAGIAEQNGGTPSLKVQNFQCVDCSAIDRQAVPTMKYGFLNTDGGAANFTVVNGKVVGATTASYQNFAGGVFQFTGGDFNALGRLIATQGVLTSTAAGAQTIPLAIVNSSNAAGTQVCYDGAPSTAGTGVRSGQLCFTNDGSNNISFSLNLSSANTPASVLAVNAASGGAITLKRDLAVANTSGTPTLASCGTSPSMATGSSDTAGQITTGSGSPTSCTLTFAAAKPVAPFCVLTWNPVDGGTGYTVSTTGIAITQGASSAQKISYVCIRGS